VCRYRLTPTPEQEILLLEHCAHARYVWNLAVEQQSWWTPRRGTAPGFAAQCRQLTEARAENKWLRSGSAVIQQQALRDFGHAMASYLNGANRKPGWRKRGRNEGFRLVGVKPGDVRRLNRKRGEIRVPKIGWVRFRWSRAVPEAKSCRVTMDRAGRWHVSFAAIPAPAQGPGTGEIIGIDRGVALTLALSDGTTWQAPEPVDFRRGARHLSRCKPGSNRRNQAKRRLAKLRAWDADRRKDFAEKASTDIARRYDLIRIEDLRIKNMTSSAKGTIAEPGVNVRQKAGLNRSILSQNWGYFAKRLEDKASGRVEKVHPAYTSQTCSECRTRDQEARESQAVFRCRACGYSENADVNAARNIAAGHAVTARGGFRDAGPFKREPQDLLLAS
jgi:IS605 OrfB family transposase